MNEQTQTSGPELDSADKGILSLLAVVPAPVLAAANLSAIKALEAHADVPLETKIAPLSHAFAYLFQKFVEPELNRLVKDESTRKLPETQLAVYYAGFLTSLLAGQGDSGKAAESALSGFPGRAAWLTRVRDLTDWITETALEAAKAQREAKGESRNGH